MGQKLNIKVVETLQKGLKNHVKKLYIKFCAECFWMDICRGGRNYGQRTAVFDVQLDRGPEMSPDFSMHVNTCRKYLLTYSSSSLSFSGQTDCSFSPAHSQKLLTRARPSKSAIFAHSPLDRLPAGWLGGHSTVQNPFPQNPATSNNCFGISQKLVNFS